MLANVIGSYLDTLTEREFDAPFMALLHLRGFVDVHFLHGQYEFGKDFIAKYTQDGVFTQFVFQTKAGNINLQGWHDIRGQLDMLRTSLLAHPNFDSALPRAARLVTTGRLIGAASLEAQAYRNHLIGLNEPVLFETWDRNTLIEYLDNTPQALGSSSPELLRLAGSSAYDITQDEIERFSRQWIHLKPSPSLLRNALEAALLANHLRNEERLDLACFCALCLLRSVLATVHGIKVLSQQASTALQAAEDLFVFYAGLLWDDCKDHFEDPDDVLTQSFPAGYAAYRVRCCIVVELLGLYGLSQRHSASQTEPAIAAYLAKFIPANIGSSQPISDRWAVSLVPPLLLLYRHGYVSVITTLLREVTLWIAERFEAPNLGLADMRADPDEEVTYLLGSAFEHVELPRRRESFVASTVLELCIAFRLHDVYELARNEFDAVGACLPVIEADDDAAQYARHVDGLRYEANMPFGFDWPATASSSPAPHHSTPTMNHYPARVHSPWMQVALSSVTRDRHYRQAWQELLKTTDGTLIR